MVKDWPVLIAGAAYGSTALATILAGTAGLLEHGDAKMIVGGLTTLLLVIVVLRTRQSTSGR